MKRFFSDSIIPIVVSVCIHALVVGALFVSWEQTQKPIKAERPKFIEAKLVKLQDQTKKKASAKRQPKKIDLTAQKKENELREQEKKKQQEQKKLAEQKAKQEAEKKQQAEAKARKEAEQKKLAAAKAKRDAERKKAEDQKRKAEQERKEKEKQRRLQQEFQDALKEEAGMLMEEQFEAEAQSYAAKLKQRVEDNWNRPPSSRTGMRCTLRIQLVPTGRVVSAEIVESSGNPAFDRSAVQAVKKVEVFPEIKDMPPELFERQFRQFKFIFNPQDLRL